MNEYKILNKVNDTKDLKKLNINELNDLAEDIRELIIDRVSKAGGHLGPNLGIVEATIALHYVFNSPIDKMVWDVSHQCYTHKILTGRKDFKLDDKISGYTNKYESEHDPFIVGHTSTSVSLATGLAKARDMKNTKENVIAIIGDGSLSGGEAFEGLDNGAMLNSNLIVLVNDNEMSISENYGGIYGNLQKLRITNGTYENNYFKSIGFEYIYVEEGNSISSLIEAFLKVKDTNKPVVVHIHTQKGKGYKFAEQNKENYHWANAFNKETGEPLNTISGITYPSVVIKTIEDKIKQKEKIMLVNAAMAKAIGAVKFREDYPDNYTDVGIAEEHAIAYISGLATGGIRPIGVFSSSFIQRTYDQLMQDLCLNNVSATLIIERAEIASTDSTHVGMYDISLLSNIPNLIYMAPKNGEELEKMIDWSMSMDCPVGIRIPGGNIPELKNDDISEIKLNKFEKVLKGEEIAILGLGNFFELAEKIVDELKEKGLNPTLINPRFISNIDEDMLEELTKNHHTVVTLEDGMIDGGFGEKINRFYAAKDVKVYNFGAKKEFIDRVPYDELMERYGLSVENIVNTILSK